MSAAHAPRAVVVDDDPEVAEMLAEILGLPPLHARTSAFTDPKEALAHVQDRPPDLLVTDLWMPGLTGLQLIHEVRRRIGELPCILVSGAPEAPMLARAAIPAIAYVPKPLDLDHLLAAAGRLLTSQAWSRI